MISRLYHFFMDLVKFKVTKKSKYVVNRTILTIPGLSVGLNYQFLASKQVMNDTGL